MREVAKRKANPMNKHIASIMSRYEEMSEMEIAQAYNATRQDLNNLRGLLRTTDEASEQFALIKATMKANVKLMDVLFAQAITLRSAANAAGR
jgi:hypothetical protein